jgi:hypothetical protein
MPNICAYKIQGKWDYANTGNSGRWSGEQVINTNLQQYDKVYRKHRIRGHGLALQLHVSSVDGLPFDIFGWSTYERSNAMV